MFNKKILVNTPPRTGTHMLARSIGNSLNIPNFVDKRLDRVDNVYDLEKKISEELSIDNLESYVFGSHMRKTDPYEKIFKDHVVITSDRHPLAQALSVLRYYHVRMDQIYREYYNFDSSMDPVRIYSNCIHYLRWCPEVDGNEFGLDKMMPNSEEFINYVISDRFKGMRKITTDWSTQHNVMDFDKIVSRDKAEIEKLSNIFNQDIIIEDMDLSEIKHSSVKYKSNKDYWKEIFSQETCDILSSHFPGYDFNSNKKDPLYGNKMFLDHCDKIKRNGFNV